MTPPYVASLALVAFGALGPQGRHALDAPTCSRDHRILGERRYKQVRVPKITALVIPSVQGLNLLIVLTRQRAGPSALLLCRHPPEAQASNDEHSD